MMQRILTAVTAVAIIGATMSNSSAVNGRGGGNFRAWEYHPWTFGWRYWTWRRCGWGSHLCAPVGWGASYGDLAGADVAGGPPNLEYSMPTPLLIGPADPHALHCHRDQETVSVPTDNGGTRQVTVRRCYP